MKGAPLPVMTILVIYACLCKFGPMLMADRKPFNLKKVMIAYNIFQIAYNTIGVSFVSDCYLKESKL
jgi:hypothetical protein